MRPNRPTIRQLEYFIAVSDARHYRRAAEGLHVSQPTITAQIATLEDNLGIKLFERSRSGVHLTPKGREMLPMARDIMTAVAALESTAKSTSSSPTGTYRLGVVPTLGPYFLPEIIPALHKRFPQLQLYFQERIPQDLEHELLDGKHDVIISPLPLSNKNLITQVLFEEPLKLVLPLDHLLSQKKQLKSTDLKNQNLLILEDRHHLHRQVMELANELDANVLSNYEGTSLDTLRQMAGMGMGIALLPSLYIRSEITAREEAEVVVRELVDKPMHRSIAISWRPHAPDRQFYRRMVELLIDLTRRTFLPHVNLQD